MLLIESKAVFRRRAFHRQKAHLVLSAMRHRAAELASRPSSSGPRHTARRSRDRLSVCHPTSRAARGLVHRLPGVDLLPPRGFVTAPADFVAWADGRAACGWRTSTGTPGAGTTC